MSASMPGMHTGYPARNPIVVAAFRSLLLHQTIVLLVISAVVGIAAMLLGFSRPRDSDGDPPTTAEMTDAKVLAEPTARRLLRIGFGLLWVIDGLLQFQTAMPLGMPTLVVLPSADGSPSWVRELVDRGASIWTDHPVTAAASAVWIQLGIGLWLLVAPRGTWSRLGGLASIAWGLVVWVFGEAFGGIFAPGLSVLFGAPGAVLLYVAAGAMIAAPERSWSSSRWRLAIPAAVGAFFVVMAVLQAWPGRGFWQGRPSGGGGAGPVAEMAQDMSQTPQPHVTASWLASFGEFVSAHGWAVNLFVVIVLAVVGLALVSCRLPLVRAAAIAGVVFCLADWVLIQDFGVFGGVGTDPNNMLPLALLIVAAWLALSRPPAVEPSRTTEATTAAGRLARWRGRMGADRGYATRVAGVLTAAAFTLVGAAPMASASVESRPDPILAQAIAGNFTQTDLQLPNFHLVDQDGRTVTQATLRGKVLLLTFLDPVCTSDCPEIAQEMRQADTILGANRSQVELVAIVANPIYRAVSFTRAFTRREYLAGVPNWAFLTGSLSQLQWMWTTLGIPVQTLPAGAMVAHGDTAFIVDRTGRIREYFDSDPGPGTAATKASFAVLLAHAVDDVLRAS